MKQRAEDGGPRERVDAEVPVGLRAHGIVHLRDHLLHAKDLLGDLSAHEIAVVAFGQGEERVGPLNARLPQNLEIGPVAEDGLALEGGR